MFEEFKVYATMSTRLQTTIEAASLEEAEAMAETMDGGEFIEIEAEWWEITQDEVANSEESYLHWSDLALDVELELGGLPFFPDLPRMPVMIANAPSRSEGRRSCPFINTTSKISYPLVK